MRKISSELIPLGFLFFLLLIFFAPILFFGQTFLGSGLIYSDLATLNYPLKHLLAQSLKEGALPFWTSLIGNGTPIFSESQIGALYPLHLFLFRFLPTPLAFNLNIFLHFFLAAFGTYLFCRVSFKLSWAASCLAALSFSLSGFMVTRIHQTNIVLVVSWLPLIFLLIERLVAKRKIYLALLLALAFALQILAGYIEIFYYTLLAGGLFLILLLFFQKERLRPVLYFFLGLILAVGICAPQILQTWEMTKYSVRSGGLTLESASADTWPFRTFSLFVNPRIDFYRSSPDYKPNDSTTVSEHDLYGYLGFIPLLLAFLAIFRFRKKPVFILTILLILTLFLALGRSTQVFTIFWETIPGLRFFRFPTKWLFFIEFTLAILAAFGWDWASGKLGKWGPTCGVKRLGIVGGAVVLVVFLDLYFNNLPKQPRVKADFWFSDPPVVEIVKEGMAVGNFRLYSHGTNNLEYGTAKDPELQREFLNILPPDTNIPFGLPSNREWYTLFLARQQKLTRLNTTLDPQNGILRLPPQMKKSLNLQGVKYLLADLPFDDPDLILVKEFPLKKQVFHYAYLVVGGQMQNVQIPVSKTYVYENKAVLPRAIWVGQAKVMEGKEDEEILAAILSEDFDPQKEVILEESIPKEVRPLGENSLKEVGPPRNSQGKAEIKNYREQVVEIETEADKDGLLFLSDTYYPGWQATVDGNPTKILRANYAFRAVEVPQGKHLVKFTFEPTYWRLGLGISAGTLLLVLLGLGYSFWKRI